MFKKTRGQQSLMGTKMLAHYSTGSGLFGETLCITTIGNNGRHKRCFGYLSPCMNPSFKLTAMENQI